MEHDINAPIVKEETIVYGCSTGQHEFNSDNSMLAMYNGVLEMRMKCTLCGVEIAQPIPGLAPTMEAESLPKDDGVPPIKEELRENPEPVVKVEEPVEEIRQMPFAESIWANDIREKYKRDKGIDKFWGDVWDEARFGK